MYIFERKQKMKANIIDWTVGLSHNIEQRSKCTLILYIRPYLTNPFS